MVDFIGKIVLIEGIKLSIKKLSEQIFNQNISQEQRERLSSALEAIRNASIQTRDFIDNKGYEPNTELSQLWNIALKKSIDAKIEDLPDYLYNKSKFWGNPKDWLNEPTSMELVPKLNTLNEKCEMILIELKK